MARVILETLRSIPVPDVHHDLRRVLAIISRLGEDSGMTVGTTTKMSVCVCVAQNNHHYHNNNAGSRLVLDGDKKRLPLMDGFQSVVSISLFRRFRRARVSCQISSSASASSFFERPSDCVVGW